MAASLLLPVKELESILTDTSKPMGIRFRALFTLRNIASDEAIDALNSGFQDSSALLKHELAYVMGQMQNPHAIPYLTKVLENPEEDCMVRHEAGEALGALGDADVLPVLQRFATDPAPEVAETCSLAVDFVQWKIQQKAKQESRQAAAAAAAEGTAEGAPAEGAPAEPLFDSVDPAPPFRKPKTVEQLRACLLNQELPLFKRYRAMFALRNENSEPAVQALVAGFADPSALFRHEIAFVLGQMQHSAAIEALTAVLKTPTEHKMVRHEAAEAIGAIAEGESKDMLSGFLGDTEPAVSESCIVALDLINYYQSDELNYVLTKAH